MCLFLVGSCDASECPAASLAKLSKHRLASKEGPVAIAVGFIPSMRKCNEVSSSFLYESDMKQATLHACSIILSDQEQRAGHEAASAGPGD